MTLYNIDKLASLKDEFLEERFSEGANVTSLNLDITSFLSFIEEKEKASFFDPNQIEIPFEDEDNSK